MKKILALLFLLPLTFVSCGEDEKDFVKQNYLVGKWEITQIGASNPQGVILYQDYVNNSECKDNYIFNTDLTFEINDFPTEGTCTSTRISGTYERLSTNVTLRYTVQVGDTPQQVSRSITVVSLTYEEAIIAYTNESNQIVYLKLNKA
jgi:hypothetical protein